MLGRCARRLLTLLRMSWLLSRRSLLGAREWFDDDAVWFHTCSLWHRCDSVSGECLQLWRSCRAVDCRNLVYSRSPSDSNQACVYPLRLQLDLCGCAASVWMAARPLWDEARLQHQHSALVNSCCAGRFRGISCGGCCVRNYLRFATALWSRSIAGISRQWAGGCCMVSCHRAWNCVCYLQLLAIRCAVPLRAADRLGC